MSNAFLEHFGRACGLTGPIGLLVTKLGEDRPVRYQLDQPFALVGRASQTDVSLDHSTVSRRHAYLQAIGGRVLCVDLGSRTGVRWPDGRRRAGWLSPGESVAIGAFDVRLASCPAAADAPAPTDTADPLSARPAEPGRLAPVSLEVATGSAPPAVWPMPQWVALAGRAGVCAIRAADEHLSPYHCAFIKVGDGLWVIDLLSEGGTKVNGESARAARLKDGDLIRAGSLTVLVRADGPAPTMPASQFGTTSALIELTPAQVAQPAAVADSVYAAVSPLHDLMRQFQECLVVMTKMFTTLQQEQMALARDQMNEFREAAREFREMRSEISNAPFAESAPDRASETTRLSPPRLSEPPRPKPLDPAAATELANAHEWLMKRLADMERQLGQPGPST
ncbi:MAG TPA: FHA domain-containing protein [Gemmataceae bacterium]|nr:FHA domain-containing protein [Gemmataceae bacterium]